MKYQIVSDINVLRKKSVLVEKKELALSVIKSLEESLDTKKGFGLSAIQIGIPLRVGIIRTPDCKLDLWNPKIIDKSVRFHFKGEGCLSIPGVYVDTSRYKEITIENGDGRKYSLEGIEAIVVQHEINHMDGKLIIDKEFKWKKRR